MREAKYDNRPAAKRLLAAIKAALPRLKDLRRRCDDLWIADDRIYRFYHQSFKVYGLQPSTNEIVQALRALAPKTKRLHPWFEMIIAEGTGRVFKPEDNKNWLAVTRPILEAFFHAKYFLEMALKYGKKLRRPPTLLPSGWAAILSLYDLR